MTMQVRDIPIAQIIVADRFRLEYGDLEELAQSIVDQGLLQPITIDEGMHLLAGGRRLEAAKLAKQLLIPCIVRPARGELDAREVELMENIHRKDLTWQERARLEKKIFELKTKQQPGWTTRRHAEAMESSKGAVNMRLRLAEALEIVPELGDCRTEDEAWKKLKRLEEDVIMSHLARKSDERVRTAHNYAKDHYIIGDAFECLTKVKDGIVGFAEVDPPYAVSLEKRKSRNVTAGTSRYSEIEPEAYPDFIGRMTKLVYAKLRDDAFVVWWYGMTWHEMVRESLRSAGFKVNDIPAIWFKGGQGQTASPDTMLGSCYEPFFIARKGEPKLRKPGRPNVFQYSPTSPSRKIHPTERPIELMIELLQTFTYPGSIVLSPFLGSGVILRACYRCGLTGFGYDLDEHTKNRFLARVSEDIMAKHEETKVKAAPPRDPDEDEDEELEEGESDEDEDLDGEDELDEEDLADALEQGEPEEKQKPAALGA